MATALGQCRRHSEVSPDCGSAPWLHRASAEHTVGCVEIDTVALRRSETDPGDLVPCCCRPFRSLAVIALIAAWFVGGLAEPSVAQEPPTYGQAIFGRSLDSEVAYVDTSATGAPSGGELEPRPEPPAFSVSGEGLDWASGLIKVIPYLILIVIVALIWKYGASIRLARRRTPDVGQRASSAKVVASATDALPDARPTPAGLEQIAQISDRDRALALLLSNLLEHALAAQQTHFRQSQTVREALRALPSGSPIVPPLREITSYVERVRFGGHTVSEPVFQRFLESGRALLRHTPRAVSE